MNSVHRAKNVSHICRGRTENVDTGGVARWPTGARTHLRGEVSVVQEAINKSFRSVQ